MENRAVKIANGMLCQPVRNIVLILADDLGICDLGCYGSDYYETPNLDRLAAEGMRFTEAYAAHSVCSPTRASLLTGRYPHRLHLTQHIPGYEPPTARLHAPQDWIKYLRQGEITYAEALCAGGFATFHVGKWHVGQEYAGLKSPGEHGFGTVHPGRSPWEMNLDDPHHIGEFTRAMETFIASHAAEPFLAVLSMDQVHVPIYEQPEWIERFARKPAGANGQNNPKMAAMIARMDWSVGRVLDQLDELGLSGNTAVVFTSDNGGLSSVYDDDLKMTVPATSNRPYRGGKSQNYEGGIRVPLIVKWPGVTRPGSLSGEPVISMDLYPTFLEMAGLPQIPEQHLDGVSLKPLLCGQGALPRDTLYWHYPHYHTLPPHSAVRCGDWKLIRHLEDRVIELFNLAEDSGESQNLAAQFPEKAKQMAGVLDEHLRVIGAQMPTENPDYDPEIPWMANRANGTADPFENNQDDDPRTYVTDPRLDYGALRAEGYHTNKGKGHDA